MPSSRRVKLFGVAAVTIILIILYLNSSSYSGATHQSRYLKSLVEVSERERLLRQQTESLVPPADHSQDLTDTAGVAERLREAEDAAKKAATDKAGPKPDSPKKVEESMKGRKGVKTGENAVEGKNKDGQEVVGPEAEPVVEYDPLVEIADYLKRAPIVIFSKSYCQYSRRAKTLLLELYHIVPPPLVVELDQHERGAELQAALAKQTGRRTVPNIMISGKSIGGSDDVYALEDDGTLVDTIKRMGGKRVTEILKIKG